MDDERRERTEVYEQQQRRLNQVWGLGSVGVGQSWQIKPQFHSGIEWITKGASEQTNK